MNIDFAPTRLIRPSGTIAAKWLGSIGTTGLVHIRYWVTDPETARNKPVMVTAHRCAKHRICYLVSDYPGGCPNCTREIGPGVPR
jgi:hypothetical protein